MRMAMLMLSAAMRPAHIWQHARARLNAHQAPRMNVYRKRTHGSCNADEREADCGMDSRERNQGRIDPGQLTAVGHSMHKCLRTRQHCAPNQRPHGACSSADGRRDDEMGIAPLECR